MSLASGLRRSIFRTAPTTLNRLSVRPAQQLFTKPTTASSSFLSNNFTATRSFSATMSQSGVHNLMAKADFDTARSESSLMVVDFFATWCGPCKAIAPQVVKLSNTYTNARFFKIDVDEVPEVAQELSIRAMPTFVLFKNGEEVATVVGANPSALEAAIKQHA